ncbi:MAG: adenosine deaminase [Actinomycetota bacterium]
MPVDLVSLPKVELHVHLEGTITAATATDLARRHGEDPASVLPLVDGRYPERFGSFLEFVELYLAVSRLVRTPDDLYTVAASFARDQAAQNIIYTEATFTALTHVSNGMDPVAMWDAVTSGFGEAGSDVEVHLIVDSVRDMGVDHAEATVRLVGSAAAPIVGLGLAGIEGSAPERDFKILRDAATHFDLGLAVHAGETGTPENVRAALDDLGADRIGHGVAAWQDRSLVERLARERVPVEVCPSSNVALRIFASLAEHPFPDMWRAGINVTINSDDPPFFSTSLTRELEFAQEVAALDAREIAELQRRAVAASFAPEATRTRLSSAIDSWEAGLPPDG